MRPDPLRIVVARTGTPAGVAEGIRAEIRRAAPDLPIESTLTMDEALAARALRIVAVGLIVGLAGTAGARRDEDRPVCRAAGRVAR